MLSLKRPEKKIGKLSFKSLNLQYFIIISMMDRGDYDKYDEDNVDDYEYGTAAEYYEEPVQENKHSSSVSDR